MFKEGDKYIHFTKYGGMNKGVVKYFNSRTVIDENNCLSYDKFYIISDKGVQLYLDGSDGKIYKINEEFTEDYCNEIREILKKPKHERIEIISKKIIKNVK